MSGERCSTCEAALEPIPDVGFICPSGCPASPVVARVELVLLATGHVQVDGRPHDLFTVARIIAQAHAFAQRVVAAKLAEVMDQAGLN